jgi:capsular polysaccharide transport system permease protein
MKLLSAFTPSRMLLWLFIIPSVLGALYYAALADDRYVSEAVVAVRDTSSGSPTSSGSSTLSIASALLGGTNPVALSDTLYLLSYVHSTDLIDKLDEKLHLRDHYANAKLDVFYGIWPWMSREYFHEYFRNRVVVTIDELSGLVTINVEAFDSAFAKKVADEIVIQSEAFMNDYAHSIAFEKMKFAQSEAESSLKRSLDMKAKIVAFQTQHKLLDPTSQAVANSSLTAGLQATLTQQEATLKASLAYLQEDSYQIKTLRSQIAATRSQLDAERLRGTSGEGSDKFGALAFEYQSMLTQGAFYDGAYQAAVLTLEQARLDSLRKLKTVVVVQKPSKPDSALYPRRWYNFATVLVICGLFFAIARLVVATIREHQD